MKDSITDDIVELISDRFSNINDIVVRRYNYDCLIVDSICIILYNFDNFTIYIVNCNDPFVVCYNELTDIDMLVGFILCKAFYD